MTFLSLIGALLLEQWRPLRTGNRLYVGFARYVNRIGQNFNAGQYRDGVISWLLAVLPVALLTLLIYFLSRQVNGLLALAWNIAVLYVALGFRQFSHFYNDVTLALRAGDLARAREILTLWRGESARDLTPSEIARVAIELGLIRSHRHVFGVMAWFVVLGPVGAILYRLSALLADRWGGAQSAAADSFGVFARRAFAIIDWLPVRLTAFSFAMTGDFTGAIECWREQAAAWHSRSQGILLASAAGALGVRLGGVLHENGNIVYRPQLGDGDEADVDYMDAAVGLTWRALVLWLFLILLATVANMF
ncbi:MAG: Cobalamin biosynthesis protein CobD [Betaproteobacteria bacterium]|nr:Cobalamin biosynthesis protein CobD [Betaproteobacteria bacterium]